MVLSEPEQNQEGDLKKLEADNAGKPRGIKISLNDIKALAAGDDILQLLDEEIIRLVWLL